MSEKIKMHIRVEQDDTPVKGNVMCSGVEEDDREAEAWVLDHLRNGNVYAWCWVEVKLTLYQFTGIDAMGGISCESKEDFEKSILPDMIRQAKHNLKSDMEDAPNVVREALERALIAKGLLRKLDKMEVERED